MSKTVDERVVSMRFDNAQFERGAKQTMDTLNQLEKSLSLDGAKRGLQEAGKAINSFSLEGIASQIDSLRAKFDWKSIIGVTALMNIANDVVNTFKNMVNQISVAPIKQGFDEYELKMGAVQTMIASTGESLETVNGYLEQLNLYADKTIYSFSDMTQNIGKFTNNGVKLEDAVKAIQGISNAAAVAGANSNEASRAMYNFSQALSQGSVKLIDWKSIQNANMATVDFKQNLIDTAVAMGTLKKKGDQYVSTTTDLSGKVSDAFDANKMFNESLSHSWMTTEVLVQTLSNYSTDVREMSEAELEAYRTKLKSIGYTEEQIKAIEELSTKAFQAATEVKTYHQLMDTLAEAVGSGWSQTFEILFGDYEESKKLWTGINDVIGGFINETSNARNEMIKAWDAFGGRTELLNSLSEAFNNAVSILRAVKSAFQDIFPKDLTAKTKGIAGAFKEVRGGARILVEATEGLAKAIKTLTPSEETLDKVSRTFRGIFAVLDMGKKIVVSIFKAIKPNAGSVLEIGNNILDITARIGDTLTNFDKNFDPEKSFEKFLNGAKMVIEEIQNFISDITDFKFQIEEWGASVGGIFAIIFNDLIYIPIETAVRLIGKLLGKSNEELMEWHEKFLRPLSNIRGAIVDFLNNFKPFENLNFKMPDFSGFKEFTDTIIDRVNPLQTAWNIVKGIGTGIVKVFSAIGNALGPIAKSLGGAIKSFFDMVSDYFKNATFDEVIDLVNSGILTVLGVQLTGLISSLKGLGGAGKTAGEAVKGPIESLIEFAKNPKESLGKLGDGLKGLFGIVNDEGDNAGILKTLSESILMLAGALFVLALIPSDKLTVSMLAITGLFTDLMKSMEFMEKSLGGGKKTLSVAASLTLVAGAMIEMALAMQVMSAMSWERVAKGLMNFGTSMGVITLTFKALKDEELIKTAGAIWIVSNAMIQMGIAMQAMSAMSWERVAKGLTIFATSMTIMTLAFKLIKGDDIIKTAGSIWIFSNAMIQMGAAMQIMGAMSWERVAKSLIVFGTSMLIIVKAFNSMSPEALISTAGAIWIMSNAMIQMGAAMQIMGAMGWESVAKGLITFAGAMIIIVKAFNSIDNNQIIKTSLSMLILGQAMMEMGVALQIMGAMSFDSVLKSLVAFGGTIAILVAALNKVSALDSVKIAASLLILSVSMTALAVAMGLLGSIGADKVLVALVALAGILGVLGAVSVALGPLVPAMALLAASLAAVGAGMLLFETGMAAMASALLKASAIGATAIASLLASFEMLLVGGIKIFSHVIGAIAELIVNLVANILKSLRAIIPDLVETFMLIVDEVLASIATHGPEILKSLIEIVSSLFTQLNSYIPTFITQIVGFIIAIIDGLAANIPDLVTSVMNFIGTLFKSIIDAMNGLDTNTLVNAILAIAAIDAMMISLAAMGTLAIPAMAGVVAFGRVITKLAFMLKTLGMISQIPGLKWLIDEGGDLLESVGRAIGKMIGGFIGGIGEGVSNSLPTIGKNLSLFMEEAEPFIAIAKTIDRSVYDGIKTLIDTMLLVTEGSVLTRITSFVTGDSDYVKFGNKLKSFGQAIKTFADATEGVDSHQIAECADATLELVKMAKQIPNEGGLVSLITGDNSLGKFAEELALFAPSFKSFADDVKDIDVDHVKDAAKATLLLTEMAASIPNTGGLVSLITGDNSLAKFAGELSVYGVHLKSFSNSITGIRIKTINSSTDATTKLISMAAKIPNSGGLVSLVTGDNSLAKFGSELSIYGKHLAKFGREVKGLISDDFTGAIDATKQLIEMAQGIPATGGLVAKVIGDNSIAKFGKELAKFGPNLSSFSESIKDVSTKKVKAAAEATRTLIDMTKDLPSTGGIKSLITGKAKLSNYGKELESFGSSLGVFAIATSGIKYSSISGAVLATQELLSVEVPKTGGIKSLFTGSINLETIGTQFGLFGPGLKTFADTTNGITADSITGAVGAATALLSIKFPSEGGVKEWFSGKRVDLSSFGEQIAGFATHLVDFSKAVSGESFDVAKIEVAANAAKTLISVANDAPPTSGLKTWISGKDRLKKFGESITDFAKTLTGEGGALENLRKIEESDATHAGYLASIISGFTNGLEGASEVNLSRFANAIAKLGKNMVSFSQSVSAEDFNVQNVSAAISQLASLTTLAADLEKIGSTDFEGLIYMFGQMSSDQLANLAEAFTTTMNAGTDCMKTIIEKLNEFTYDIGMDKQTITTHLSGIEKAIELLKTKAISEFDVIKSNLSLLLSSFKIAFDIETYEELGNNVPLGIAKGLDAGEEEVKGSAKRLAEMIIKTIEDRLDEHSPSEEGSRIGMFFDKGIAKGMTKGITEIEDSGTLAADTAMNAMKDAFKQINTLAEEELNVEPTIRPVVDLSGARNEYARLGTMFSRGLAMSTSYKDTQGIIRSRDINSGALSAGIDPKQFSTLIEETRITREQLSEYNNNIQNLRVVMDTGATIGALGRPMDEYLGMMSVNSGRGIV